MDLNNVCPKCGSTLPAISFFCPVCGRKLREKPFSTANEIYYYLLSLIIPPLGYWYWIKFHSSTDERTKRVAYVSAVLTTISLLVTIWLTKTMLDAVSSAVGISTLHQDFNSLGL